MADETAFRDALAQHAERRQGGQEILMALQENETTPRSRGRGRVVWAAAAALAIAGGVIGGTALLGSSPAAYAVTKNADGTVTVSIKDIKAIEPANAKLRELGVRAKAVPMTSDCAPLNGASMYNGSDWDVPNGVSNDSVTIGTKIPSGYTVLLSVSDKPGRGTGLGYTGPVQGPAPSCVLDPADDPDQRATN
nr:hypothetical protein [Kibdelosporangium sp. MJ126-NF4]CEL17784.1 hypothetical protein [Kibdelosporangium sp. MJ126-NF4]CTQ90992.1 hypothetical protein [Kibdelosporangium sp. MJ126-NF4]